VSTPEAEPEELAAGPYPWSAWQTEIDAVVATAPPLSPAQRRDVGLLLHDPAAEPAAQVGD
jgi:hypothetical protein